MGLTMMIILVMKWSTTGISTSKRTSEKADNGGILTFENKQSYSA
jgi:hypothetical protein